MADPAELLDVFSPSENCVDPPTFTDVPTPDIYGMLQEGLRETDKDTEFLKRYLKRPEELYARLAQKLWRLTLLSDPVHCPADLLDCLLLHVGFGEGSSLPWRIAKDLDEAHKRKLVKLAVPYWKRRGRRDALSDSIRTLTGIRPQIDDWFYVRWLIDEVLLGVSGLPGADPWLLWEDASGVPAGVADGNVRVSLRAPDEVGTLNRQLVQDLCELARPLSERYEIAYVDFLDTFADGLLGHWQTLDVAWQAASSSAQTLAGLKFDASGSYARAVTPLSPLWTKTHLFLILRFGNADEQEVNIRFYERNLPAPLLTYYCMNLNTLTKTVKYQVFTWPGPPVDIKVVNAGALLDTPSSRGIRIDVEHVGAGPNQVRFYIDGDIVLEDATDSTNYTGGFLVQVPGGYTNQVYLHRAECYQKPLSIVTLAP